MDPRKKYAVRKKDCKDLTPEELQYRLDCLRELRKGIPGIAPRPKPGPGPKPPPIPPTPPTPGTPADLDISQRDINVLAPSLVAGGIAGRRLLQEAERYSRYTRPGYDRIPTAPRPDPRVVPEFTDEQGITQSRIRPVTSSTARPGSVRPSREIRYVDAASLDPVNDPVPRAFDPTPAYSRQRGGSVRRTPRGMGREQVASSRRNLRARGMPSTEMRIFSDPVGPRAPPTLDRPPIRAPPGLPPPDAPPGPPDPMDDTRRRRRISRGARLQMTQFEGPEPRNISVRPSGLTQGPIAREQANAARMSAVEGATDQTQIVTQTARAEATTLRRRIKPPARTTTDPRDINVSRTRITPFRNNFNIEDAPREFRPSIRTQTDIHPSGGRGPGRVPARGLQMLGFEGESSIRVPTVASHLEDARAGRGAAAVGRAITNIWNNTGQLARGTIAGINRGYTRISAARNALTAAEDTYNAGQTSLRSLQSAVTAAQSAERSAASRVASLGARATSSAIDGVFNVARATTAASVWGLDTAGSVTRTGVDALGRLTTAISGAAGRAAGAAGRAGTAVAVGAGRALGGEMGAAIGRGIAAGLGRGLGIAAAGMFNPVTDAIGLAVSVGLILKDVGPELANAMGGGSSSFGFNWYPHTVVSMGDDPVLDTMTAFTNAIKKTLKADPNVGPPEGPHGSYSQDQIAKNPTAQATWNLMNSYMTAQEAYSRDPHNYGQPFSYHDNESGNNGIGIKLTKYQVAQAIQQYRKNPDAFKGIDPMQLRGMGLNPAMSLGKENAFQLPNGDWIPKYMASKSLNSGRGGANSVGAGPNSNYGDDTDPNNPKYTQLTADQLARLGDNTTDAYLSYDTLLGEARTSSQHNYNSTTSGRYFNTNDMTATISLGMQDYVNEAENNLKSITDPAVKKYVQWEIDEVKYNAGLITTEPTKPPLPEGLAALQELQDAQDQLQDTINALHAQQNANLTNEQDVQTAQQNLANLETNLQNQTGLTSDQIAAQGTAYNNNLKSRISNQMGETAASNIFLARATGQPIDAPTGSYITDSQMSTFNSEAQSLQINADGATTFTANSLTPSGIVTLPDGSPQVTQAAANNTLNTTIPAIPQDLSALATQPNQTAGPGATPTTTTGTTSTTGTTNAATGTSSSGSNAAATATPTRTDTADTQTNN